MSDFDPVLASALADDEEPHRGDAAPRSGRETCANCGASLSGAYCGACGQRDQPLRQPVHRFLAQSAAEFFGVDGRVWATLRELLLRPGALTVAFVEGRRRRYLRPLRVYLTSTLLFFVLLALLDPVGRVERSFAEVTGADPDSMVVVADHLAEVEAQIAAAPARDAREQRAADSLRSRADSLRTALRRDGGGVSLDSLSDAVGAQVEAELEAIEDAADAASEEADDAAEARGEAVGDVAEWRLEAALLGALPPDSTVRLRDVHAARMEIYPEATSSIGLPEWLGRSEALRRLEEARSGDEAASAGASFAREAIGKIPTALFLILPVFALLLKLLYARREWYYAEHLVFGLHTHAFAFLVFTVMACLLAVTTADWATTLSLVLFWLGIPLYFLLAQKRVYGQGWVKTIAKALVLGWAYSIVLAFGLVGVVFLAAALGG